MRSLVLLFSFLLSTQLFAIDCKKSWSKLESLMENIEWIDAKAKKDLQIVNDLNIPFGHYDLVVTFRDSAAGSMELMNSEIVRFENIYANFEFAMNCQKTAAEDARINVLTSRIVSLRVYMGSSFPRKLTSIFGKSLSKMIKSKQEDKVLRDFITAYTKNNNDYSKKEMFRTARILDGKLPLVFYVVGYYSPKTLASIAKWVDFNRVHKNMTPLMSVLNNSGQRILNERIKKNMAFMIAHEQMNLEAIFNVNDGQTEMQINYLDLAYYFLKNNKHEQLAQQLKDIVVQILTKKIEPNHFLMTDIQAAVK